jgi:biotin synthase
LQRDIANDPSETGTLWNGLASRVLAGHELTEAEGQSILDSSNDELLDVLAAAYRIRRHYFGNTVHLHFLISAKSGLCPEDCGYCSQSRVSSAEIPRYNLLNREQLMDGARIAAERGSRTYCIVISARGPSERELREVEKIIPEIKSKYPVRICTSLGLLSREQADRLKACGVDRVNHNVNTSEQYYAEICTTHGYQDRITTLRAVREAGLEICSGGIIGMGERSIDVVRMAIELRALRVQSIPLNFFHAIPGTPLAESPRLDARYCLKALALFRFANPACELRMAAGRELHLGSMQCLGLYAANSLFVGDYLTTKGQPPEADYRMIEEMGFEITKNSLPGAAVEVISGRE